MVQANRPADIIAILKSVGIEYPADMRATLEAYISELETRQPARPAHITAILRSIDPDHPGDRGMLLETYISALEASQRTIQPDKQARYRDPEWQYWHGIERAKQRRNHAVRKPYQGK